MTISGRMRRPVLKAFGGKFRIAPWIISHFPPHRFYTEAFGFSASVLLAKPRSYSEVYNDLNSEVVNVFRMVRDRGEELREAIFFTPYSREEFENAYTPSDDPIEQARRTIAKSFMGFGANTVCSRRAFRGRCTLTGVHPATSWSTYPEHFQDFIDRMRGVIIEQMDANELLRKYDGEGVVHYVDPPYVHSTRGSDRYTVDMDDEGQLELSNTLRELKGIVFLSGYRSEMYDDLYRDWYRVERQTLADGARDRTECLWSNRPFSRSLFTEIQ